MVKQQPGHYFLLQNHQGILYIPHSSSKSSSYRALYMLPCDFLKMFRHAFILSFFLKCQHRALQGGCMSYHESAHIQYK